MVLDVVGLIYIQQGQTGPAFILMYLQDACRRVKTSRDVRLRKTGPNLCLKCQECMREVFDAMG
jgi:hypothetical protein